MYILLVCLSVCLQKHKKIRFSNLLINYWIDWSQIHTQHPWWSEECVGQPFSFDIFRLSLCLSGKTPKFHFFFNLLQNYWVYWSEIQIHYPCISEECHMQLFLWIFRPTHIHTDRQTYTQTDRHPNRELRPIYYRKLPKTLIRPRRKLCVVFGSIGSVFSEL